MRSEPLKPAPTVLICLVNITIIHNPHHIYRSLRGTWQTFIICSRIRKNVKENREQTDGELITENRKQTEKPIIEATLISGDRQGERAHMDRTYK